MASKKSLKCFLAGIRGARNVRSFSAVAEGSALSSESSQHIINLEYKCSAHKYFSNFSSLSFTYRCLWIWGWVFAQLGCFLVGRETLLGIFFLWSSIYWDFLQVLWKQNQLEIKIVIVIAWNHSPVLEYSFVRGNHVCILLRHVSLDIS